MDVITKLIKGPAAIWNGSYDMDYKNEMMARGNVKIFVLTRLVCKLSGFSPPLHFFTSFYLAAPLNLFSSFRW